MIINQAFKASPELGMKSVKIVLSKSSFSYESLPEEAMSAINLGYYSFKSTRNFCSNLGISEVTTPSKNPLTPA